MSHITNGKELLWQFLQEIALMTDMDNSSDQDQVKLMTIHASKWLEFPVVTIGWLEEGNFPWANSALDPDELEEERRLMYVAITRAEDTLIMSAANARMVWGKTQYMRPSRFITEIPAELVRAYDFSTTNPLAWWSRKKAPIATDIVAWDRIVSRLFGAGVVLELWSDVAIVKFDKAVYGTRKVDIRLLEKE